MSTTAVREHQSALEAALLDVRATLAALLSAADAQYAAVVERDRVRIEDVTRQQEVLSARLERAERRRVEVLDGAPLQRATADLPAPSAQRVSSLTREIASSVRSLQQRHAQTATLLERSIDLAGETVGFLQRLVVAQAPVYSPRGAVAARGSLLVDGRA
jgi:flagellar biosynthesis/type III secretory pathway chaperone